MTEKAKKPVTPEQKQAELVQRLAKKLGLPPNQKFKDTPVLNLVLLRLVTGQAQVSPGRANAETMAVELNAKVADVLGAANNLSTDGVITVTAFNLPEFEYTVYPGLASKLAKQAKSLVEHLKANGGNIKVPGPAQMPPLLPKIDPEQRQKCMAEAAKLAKRLMTLEQEHLTWSLAGCCVRLGYPAVEQLVADTAKAKPGMEVGALRMFFEAYCALRDQNLKANKP